MPSRYQEWLPIALIVAAACGGSSGDHPKADAPAEGLADGRAPDAPPGPDLALWHGRADDALETMLLRYWVPASAYIASDAPTSGQVTQYWTFAQAYDAVLDGVERTRGAKFAGWIETFYNSQNAIGWSRDYYDDENWMALALIRAYDLTHDAKYLNQAKSLYADIQAAWDTSCCGASPGGLWWDRPHTQKATAANAGAVITGVRLAARTGDQSYLTFAEQVFAYWYAHMVDPATHAVVDHITTSGQLVQYKFTYNEGLVIGAAVALHGATGDAQYLADAHAVAGYMIANETEASADGTVLFDGKSCGGDCQQFKGIGYRYLQELAAADPTHPEYAPILDASGRAVFDLARGSNGLFATDWAGPAATSASIDADSSATMTLSLYASGLGADPDTAGTKYEAEDGVNHAIGLEATQPGYSGWAYLAGWQGDGEWVDFHPDVATAGTYHLAIRYAAGAGDASRLVFANGANVVANFALPATGSWSTWSTVTADIPLAAGANTVSIIYNSGMGSTNYVNLDWVTVSP